MDEVRKVGVDDSDYQFAVRSDSDPKVWYNVWISRQSPWIGYVGCNCMDSQTRKAKNRPTLLEGYCKHVGKLKRWAEEINKS